MMIINYLKKGFIIIFIKQIDIETVMEIFLNHFVRNHRLPDAIVLDHGHTFIEGLWKCLCQLLKITRRLSTAFHSEMDGSIKRANAEVKAYL